MSGLPWYFFYFTTPVFRSRSKFSSDPLCVTVTIATPSPCWNQALSVSSPDQCQKMLIQLSIKPSLQSHPLFSSWNLLLPSEGSTSLGHSSGTGILVVPQRVFTSPWLWPCHVFYRESLSLNSHQCAWTCVSMQVHNQKKSFTTCFSLNISFVILICIKSIPLNCFKIFLVWLDHCLFCHSLPTRTPKSSMNNGSVNILECMFYIPVHLEGSLSPGILPLIV